MASRWHTVGQVEWTMREKTQKNPSFASTKTARSRVFFEGLGAISTYKEVCPSGQAIKNENRRKGFINNFSVVHPKAKGMQESGRAQLLWAVRV